VNCFFLINFVYHLVSDHCAETHVRRLKISKNEKRQNNLLVSDNNNRIV
jgi:hypothetical protein